jgi:hypothetical protein
VISRVLEDGIIILATQTYNNILKYVTDQLCLPFSLNLHVQPKHKNAWRFASASPVCCHSAKIDHMVNCVCDSRCTAGPLVQYTPPRDPLFLPVPTYLILPPLMTTQRCNTQGYLFMGEGGFKLFSLQVLSLNTNMGRKGVTYFIIYVFS